jgi:PAS domain S-box-containing protein
MTPFASIKGKLLFWNLVLMLGITAAISGAAYYLMTEGLMKTQRAHMEFLAQEATHHIGHNMDAMKEEARNMARGREFDEYKHKQWDTTLERFFTEQMGAFESLSYINEQGEEQLRVGVSRGGKVRRLSELRSFGNSWFYREAMKAPNEPMLVMTGDGAEMTSSMEGGLTPGITVLLARQGYFGDDFKGVIMGTATYDWVFRHLGHISIGATGHALVANREGEIIFCPNKCVGWLDFEQEPTEDASSVLKRLSPEDTYFGRVSYGDKEVLVAAAQVTESGLFVLIMHDYAEFMEAPQRLGKVTVLIVFVAVLLGYAVFYVLAARISAPIRDLARMAEGIAGGDFSARAEVESDDEIGKLAEAFNGMSGMIRAVTSSLASAKEQAELIYKVSPSAIFTVDTHQRITSWNDMAAEITGYTAGEVMGKSCRAFSKTTCDRSCGLLSGKTELPVRGKVCTITNKAGEVRTVSKNLDLLRDEEGKVIGGIESFEDVTERVRAEERVREQSRFLEDVLGSIQDGVSILDKDLNIIHVNPVMEKLYRHQMPIKGRKCHEVYHGAGETCTGCPSLRTLEGGGRETEVVPLTAEDGEVTGWLELVTSPFMDSKTGEVAGVIELVRDITERRLAEARVEESEERFRDIVDNTGDWIWEADASGKYTYSSPAVERVLGYSAGEILNTYIFDHYPSDEREELKSGMIEAFRKRFIFKQSVTRSIRKESARTEGP